MSLWHHVERLVLQIEQNTGNLIKLIKTINYKNNVFIIYICLAMLPYYRKVTLLAF